jgi:restriction system protein
MPAERPNSLSRILTSTAATLARPLQIASAALSFFRGGRDPAIDSRQAAALEGVDKRQWSAQLLKQLEWRRFEELCVAYYETLGYQASVARSAKHTGVDIRLTAEGADKPSIVVRCEAWDAYRVGLKAVRELRDAMTAAGLAEGLLLTSGRFTHEAVTYARAQHIHLIDGAELLAAIMALPPEKAHGLLKFATQGDFLTPTCPSCSLKMISRKSTKDGRKYWGCRNYPRCKHTLPSLAHALG